jgi:hypothetical protein
MHSCYDDDEMTVSHASICYLCINLILVMMMHLIVKWHMHFCPISCIYFVSQFIFIYYIKDGSCGFSSFRQQMIRCDQDWFEFLTTNDNHEMLSYLQNECICVFYLSFRISHTKAKLYNVIVFCLFYLNDLWFQRFSKSFS